MHAAPKYTMYLIVYQIIFTLLILPKQDYMRVYVHDLYMIHVQTTFGVFIVISQSTQSDTDSRRML